MPAEPAVEGAAGPPFNPDKIKPPMPDAEDDPATSGDIVDIGCKDGKGTVAVPTSSILFQREIRVPTIVVAGAFGVKVLPPVEMPLESFCMTWLFIIVLQ